MEIRGGVVPPGSPTCLDPISDQKLFANPFSDLASKIHTFYQTRRSQKLCYHYLLSSNCKYLQYLQLERQQKKDRFRIRILLFLSYSLEIETTNTFMPLPYSLENHTRIQTKMGKVYSPFIPKRRKNHTLWGGTYPQGKYKGVYFPGVGGWEKRRESSALEKQVLRVCWKRAGRDSLLI